VAHSVIARSVKNRIVLKRLLIGIVLNIVIAILIFIFIEMIVIEFWNVLYQVEVELLLAFLAPAAVLFFDLFCNTRSAAGGVTVLLLQNGVVGCQHVDGLVATGLRS